MTGAPQQRPSIEDLNAYLDGELRGDRQHAVAQALMRDPDASAQVSAYRRHDELLRVALSELAVAPKDGPRAAIRPRTAAASGVSQLSRRTAILATLMLGLSAATAGGWLLTQRTVDQQRLLVDLARQAMLVHLAYAGESTPESPPPARLAVARELRDALGVAAAVPDLSRFGLKLTAVRKPETGPASALLLVYTGQGGTRISCYFVQLSGSRDTAFNRRQMGSVGAVYRIDDGIGYAVVGAPPLARLAEIAATGLRYDVD